MTKNKYKHFNPVTHKIESKIATIRRGHHYKFNINYHIIWIPEYRKHILVGKMKEVLKTIIEGQCYNMKINPLIQLRICFPDLRYLGYKQHYGKGFPALWAVGYYCGSAGHVSQERVKRYIQEQEGKDVFEYDIFNCPKELKGQLKIGDFCDNS